jgi:predicted exporter
MISVVMVDDLSRADALATLRGAAEGLPGVRWVDRTADFSQLLGHYRKLMGGCCWSASCWCSVRCGCATAARPGACLRRP